MRQARNDPSIVYAGMTREHLRHIRAWNRENQLDDATQNSNLNHAFESYAKARKARDEYQRIQTIHDLTDDRFANTRTKAELAQEMARLRREGLWSPDRPWHERWYDDATTLNRRIAVEQQGIIVRCYVEWSTGSIWDPLLMINVRLERDSPTYFPSHVPKNPDTERHYSVVHMGECERSVPNWGYHTAELFKKFHGRRCWLVTEEPFWDNTDTGIYLDHRYDPIASDPDFRILNAAYKPGQGRERHITL